MKTISLLFTVLLSVSAFALDDGKYVGINQKTGGVCSLRIVYDGDYAYYGKVEYRITIHNKGPLIDCKDYDGNEFETCASASQTNYQREDEEKSLYILGLDENKIEKVYFQDSDFNSTNDVVCLNMIKKI